METLGFIPQLLLVVLLAVLLRARAYRSFPWFFSYTVFAVLAGFARMASYGNKDLYFWVFWITDVGYSVGGVAVLYEAFAAVFGHVRRLRWVRLLFPLAVLGSIVATLLRAHAVPSQIEQPALAWILQGELAVRYLQAEIFIFLVLLVPILGLRWRQHPIGICAGYGLYAAVALLITTKFSDFGTRFRIEWGVASVVAYSAAVCIWIGYFLSPPRAEAPHPKKPPLPLHELQAYSELARKAREL